MTHAPLMFVRVCAGQAYAFMHTNEIVNREDAVEQLDVIVEGEGNFVCL